MFKKLENRHRIEEKNGEMKTAQAEINDQIGESNILHWQELPGRRHTERTGKIGLSAAGSTQQNDVVVLMDVVAGTETKQFFPFELSVRQILHIFQTCPRVGEGCLPNQLAQAVTLSGVPLRIHKEPKPVLESHRPR